MSLHIHRIYIHICIKKCVCVYIYVHIHYIHICTQFSLITVITSREGSRKGGALILHSIRLQGFVLFVVESC